MKTVTQRGIAYACPNHRQSINASLVNAHAKESSSKWSYKWILVLALVFLSSHWVSAREKTKHGLKKGRNKVRKICECTSHCVCKVLRRDTHIIIEVNVTNGSLVLDAPLVEINQKQEELPTNKGHEENSNGIHIIPVWIKEGIGDTVKEETKKALKKLWNFILAFFRRKKRKH